MKLPKIEFKHIFGIGIMIMAYHVFDIAMTGLIPKDNDKYVAPIVDVFKDVILILVGFFWGSSLGSKNKEQAMINSGKTPTIVNTTPDSKTTITPAQIDNKEATPISDTKDQIPNQDK